MNIPRNLGLAAKELEEGRSYICKKGAIAETTFGTDCIKLKIIPCSGAVGGALPSPMVTKEFTVELWWGEWVVGAGGLMLKALLHWC